MGALLHARDSFVAAEGCMPIPTIATSRFMMVLLELFGGFESESHDVAAFFVLKQSFQGQGQGHTFSELLALTRSGVLLITSIDST